MDRPLTPNLDRLLEKKNEVDVIGNFLEFLYDRGLKLVHEDHIPDHVWRNVIDDERGFRELIGTHIGVSSDEVDREQSDLLSYVQWVNTTVSLAETDARQHVL